MNNKTVLKFFFAAIITIVFFASCDKDYNEIGTDVIGDDHFGFEKYTAATVVAYDKATGVVQSNNLPLNPLGIYSNPVFGTTKANFVTQLEIASANLGTDFGDNLVINDVVLSVPYFSTKESTATDGAGTYSLDSIYGAGKIKLNIFESGYYLNELDPDTGFEQAQKFYNDDTHIAELKRGAAADGSSIPGGARLNDSANPSQNDNFFFDKNEIVTVTTNDDDEEVTTRTVPAMKLHLNNNFFKKKIIEASETKIANNTAFRDYFRGLYFEVADDNASDGTSMAMMDFSKGTITIGYTEDKVTIVENVTTITRVDKTFVLNLKGNSISLLEQTNKPAYASAITEANANTTTGDEKLYIKGGQGSISVIDLFGPDTNNNDVADELEQMRNENWLINEANLTFYVDNTSMNVEENTLKAREPQRIYLYDLTNKRPLFDWSTDGTTNSSDPKKNKSIHGGLIEKETTGDKRGIKYKIRITNHIRNLIRNDSINVRLGLAVTESIGVISNARLKNQTTLPLPFTNESTVFDRLPAASVINPLGTILWGTSPVVPEDKRLKLEIYYTKPN